MVARYRQLALLVATLVDFVATSVPVQAVVIRPVALTGQSAAGAVGTKFEHFNEYAINSAGQVFVAATLDVDPFDKGLWLAEPTGPISLMARYGEPAPASVPGLEFSSSLAHHPGPIADDAGNAFFTSDVSGNGEYGRGAWLGGADGLQSIALTSEQAPGAESGLVLWDFKQSYRHNLAGESVFESLIVDPANRDITNITSDRGLFRHNPQSGLSLVVRRGMAAPDLTDGVELDGFGPAALTNSGDLLVFARLRGESINSNNVESLWLHRPNQPLSLLVRQGDPVDGLPSNLNYRLAFMEPNGATEMAFITGLEGEGIDDSNSDAVLSFSPGNGLSLVARTGDQAPGTPPGVHFFGEYITLNWPPPFYTSAFRNADMLNNGRVMFHAHLAGPGVDATNDRGIWMGDASGIELLIREGEPVPDMPLGTAFGSIEVAHHNQLSEMILAAEISGPGINDSNNRGYWRVSPDQPPELLLREGDLVAVGPGDVRRIDLLFVNSTSGNDDGSPSRFNDAGQLVFRTNFTDGTQGVLILDTSQPILPGDYNLDGSVDSADYLEWRRSLGLEAVGLTADGDGNGVIDQADYGVWRANFGRGGGTGAMESAIPEPCTLFNITAALVSIGCIAGRNLWRHTAALFT